MAEPTYIWPNGTIEFGVGRQDGDNVVVVAFADDDGTPYRMVMRAPVFVTMADHFQMLSDEIAAGRISFPKD